MRLLYILCSTFLLANTQGIGLPLVEKGFDSCHHAVYGRAEKKMPSGQTNIVREGVVKLQRVGTSRKIGFSSKSSAFTIHHTGTYVIDYFLKAHAMARNGEELIVIGVQINNSLRGIRYLDLMNSTQDLQEVILDNAYFSGNGTIFENLRKGDKIRLVVAKVESQTPPFFANYYTGTDLPPATVAYLDIHKAEKKGARI